MQNKPYALFGTKLREIRSMAKESTLDVSGAVEADENLILDLEAGKVQPSEDMVLLLISHFSLKEEDALKFWELAGYEQSESNIDNIENRQEGHFQKTYFTNNDIRILYTDMVHVKANSYGVVINFMQSLSSDDHTAAVSRIGMSHEHAESLLRVLQQTVNTAKAAKRNQEKGPNNIDEQK